MHKQGTFAKNGATEMKFGMIEGEKGGELNGVGFMWISRIFMMQDDICQ